MTRRLSRLILRGMEESKKVTRTQFNLRCSEALLAKLDMLARRKGVNRSETVRQLVEKALADER